MNNLDLQKYIYHKKYYQKLYVFVCRVKQNIMGALCAMVPMIKVK